VEPEPDNLDEGTGAGDRDVGDFRDELRASAPG
jgi:hypothetical protein